MRPAGARGAGARRAGWLALAALSWPGAAGAACRLALVLALDVSGSVDGGEYRQQADGIAAALADAEVQAAILADPDTPVALAAFEWSSASFKRQVLDWTLLTDTATIDAASETFRRLDRAPGPEATGIGAAMLHAKDLLDQGPVCWARTLDISSDGENNDWPDPELVKRSGSIRTLTINALVVSRNFASFKDLTNEAAAQLSAYFSAQVIQGPDAFVEVAIGYEDYARAIRKKLLRELATRPVGELAPLGAQPSRLAARQ